MTAKWRPSVSLRAIPHGHAGADPMEDCELINETIKLALLFTRIRAAGPLPIKLSDDELKSLEAFNKVYLPKSGHTPEEKDQLIAVARYNRELRQVSAPPPPESPEKKAVMATPDQTETRSAEVPAKETTPRPVESNTSERTEMPPSRTKARSVYEWALSAIVGAEEMTVAELFNAIQKDPRAISEVLDMLPDNAETFGRYLREAGVRRYDKTCNRRSSRSVRRSNEI